MNEKSYEFPMNYLEDCWNCMSKIQNDLLHENRMYDHSKNYIPADRLDTLKKACDELREFIDENSY